jgi:tRNA-modifying protein YgfZ
VSGTVIEQGPTPLWVRGKDAAAFLHRMSTNDVAGLPGGAIDNVFTDARGRIVAHAVQVTIDDGILLLVSGGAQKLVTWLDGYLFTEQVTMIIAGHSLRLWSAADAPPDVLVVVGAGTWWVREHGDFAGIKLADDATVTITRIRAGIPGDGELHNAYGPLEVGLQHAVSWTKGCYVGQEVIAKMDTYQKVRRRLWRVFATVVPTVGSEVNIDGVVVGKVTSGLSPGDQAISTCAPSLSNDACALAVVKTATVPEADACVTAHIGDQVVTLQLVR